MRIKRMVQIATDALMTVLLLVCFAVPWTGVLRHERLGIVLFVLILLHNALNFCWYQTLFTGPYNAKRTGWAAINLLLLAAFVLTAISGAAISRHVFGFLDMGAPFVWRKIHLCASYWGLALTGMHAGLHFPPAAWVCRSPRLWKLAAWVLAAAGLYACVALNLWPKLLFLETFATSVPSSAAASVPLHLAVAGLFAVLARLFFSKNLTNK